MGLEISHRLHVTSGAPTGQAALPDLPGATHASPPMFDRIGESLQATWPLTAASGVGGAVIGAKLLRGASGGIFRGLAGGVAGALAGAAIELGAATLVRGTRTHDTPAIPAGSPAAQTTVAMREHVRVMTWNLHGGMGGPKKFFSSSEELDQLAAAIRREDPDVLLLQEVDRFAVRSNLTDTLSQLDDRLHPTAAVGATAETTVIGRNQDVAVMTFHGFGVSDARNVEHPDPRGGGFGVRARSFLNQGADAIDHVFGSHLAKGDTDYQVRNTIDTMVRTPAGNDVRVLSGHYEWPNARFDHQELEIGALGRAVAAWHGPTIWGGDFNVQRDTPDGTDERRMMAVAGLTDTRSAAESTSAPGATDPRAGEGSGGGIDRIYASDHARVVGSHIATQAGDASDHTPVVSDLELVPASNA
ncbi:MAG: metal-dependent hydrolase [Thermoleophilia bacterium]|nr:metal-dependent hydrolase [Thermoleophilia bacterium]